MRARIAAKSDDNQKAVVKALRQAGCTVAVTSRAGDGFPDLVVGRSGVNLLLEVKDGNKPPSARKLTPDQEQFHGTWSGQVAIVYTPDDALRAVNVLVQSRAVERFPCWSRGNLKPCGFEANDIDQRCSGCASQPQEWSI